jgi:hypothetical protein
VYLADGQTVTVAIEGIGELRNAARAQAELPEVPPAGAELPAKA